MGTILYKPHCAKCGALIEGDITYREVEERIMSTELYRNSPIMINPYKCKCCGQPFSVIEIPMPKKLPTIWE